MPRSEAILTLKPCNKVELRPVAAHAGLRTVFVNACKGLSITPEQLCQELEEDGDIPNLVSGELRPAALRVIAETLSAMRHASHALKPTPAEPRRRAVLCMVMANPGITCGTISDTEIEPDAVIITVVIRDNATCELRSLKMIRWLCGTGNDWGAIQRKLSMTVDTI